MTPGGPDRGREFAHIHTAYKEDSHPDVISAKAKGVPWQGYQGGGQGSMHLCLTLKDAASVVESGWGETHLLAGMEMGGGTRVARGTMLVYAQSVDSARNRYNYRIVDNNSVPIDIGEKIAWKDDHAPLHVPGYPNKYRLKLYGTFRD